MLRFRRKIIFFDILLFLIFVACLSPFVEFDARILLFGALILMLYSIMTWAIIHRLSRPIQQIISAILPYQEGREEYLPRIVLNPAGEGDEFSKLAFTLNSLTEKIRKQIENLMQQRRETEGILESLGEGVVALDTNARVTFANQVACTILSVSHDALLNQPLDQIRSSSEGLLRKCHELVVQVLQTGASIVQPWILGAGQFNLISAPLALKSGVILVLQDKTSDHKMLEMGKDFIANASHELRTPITIIRGFAETLQDHPELSSEMRREFAEKIVRTCGRLDKLVKSLLTMADIERLSTDRLWTCDLVLLANHCKQLLETAHPDVNITISSDVSHVPVAADSDLLDLAIMNLLENAVKYSSHPAEITMAIKSGDGEVRLSVQDKGIGIPSSDLPHIFNRFYTVDKARSRKSGGAGLGLSIVKTVIEKHQGRVTVNSELGRGSQFTIVLPQRAADHY